MDYNGLIKESIMSLSSNISALQSHQTYMNVNANNIANSNTDGFVPKQTTISENALKMPQAQVQSASDNGSSLSQTNLSKELTDQIVIEDTVKANVATIKTQEQMNGTLLDIKV
jgi:flagellar hook protein FlgE